MGWSVGFALGFGDNVGGRDVRLLGAREIEGGSGKTVSAEGAGPGQVSQQGLRRATSGIRGDAPRSHKPVKASQSHGSRDSARVYCSAATAGDLPLWESFARSNAADEELDAGHSTGTSKQISHWINVESTPGMGSRAHGTYRDLRLAVPLVPALPVPRYTSPAPHNTSQG